MCGGSDVLTYVEITRDVPLQIAYTKAICCIFWGGEAAAAVGEGREGLSPNSFCNFDDEIPGPVHAQLNY